MSPGKTACGLLVIAAIAVIGASATGAQNLDKGKSASKLFAETCASCHRSARGLAKDRFSLTLYMYLQKHYTSDASSAWALASYLNSVDGPKRTAAKASAAKAGASRSVRPPATVPR